jgi:hypothetical protein
MWLEHIVELEWKVKMEMTEGEYIKGMLEEINERGKRKNYRNVELKKYGEMCMEELSCGIYEGNRDLMLVYSKYVEGCFKYVEEMRGGDGGVLDLRGYRRQM